MKKWNFVWQKKKKIVKKMSDRWHCTSYLVTCTVNETHYESLAQSPHSSTVTAWICGLHNSMQDGTPLHSACAATAESPFFAMTELSVAILQQFGRHDHLI
ncbi:hypothetical protein CDAR_459331 [Caerostris darwini]|uniref:Uncharacterized protein n=1 Tax=Caerostris darwini TaxID=1538125 RepID=A0AAV4R3F1_9ARAC|nr:hypothetical protein CDAR_459331 [Caerostris darwini]